jgi:MFS transporter, DHA2 family, methylenomycin A resistance protein
VAAFGAVVATQASFLHGLHVSYLTAAVLLAITAAASTTLRRVTR